MKIPDKSYHFLRKSTLTNNGEEPCVQLVSQDTRRELAHKCLEQPRDGMRIPVLIRGKPLRKSVRIWIESLDSEHGRP